MNDDSNDKTIEVDMDHDQQGSNSSSDSYMHKSEVDSICITGYIEPKTYTSFLYAGDFGKVHFFSLEFALKYFGKYAVTKQSYSIYAISPASKKYKSEPMYGFDVESINEMALYLRDNRGYEYFEKTLNSVEAVFRLLNLNIHVCCDSECSTAIGDEDAMYKALFECLINDYFVPDPRLTHLVVQVAKDVKASRKRQVEKFMEQVFTPHKELLQENINVMKVHEENLALMNTKLNQFERKLEYFQKGILEYDPNPIVIDDEYY